MNVLIFGIAHAAAAFLILPRLIRRRLWRDALLFACLLAYSAYDGLFWMAGIPRFSLIAELDHLFTPPGRIMETWLVGPAS